MASWTHGGDWAAYQCQYGVLPLDFSANVSPLGVPPGVRTALRGAADEANRYPDPLCRLLRQTIAARMNVPAGWVLCGNGASDLIYRVVFAARPERALLAEPCFGEYAAALAAAGCEPVRYLMGPAFCLDDAILSKINHNIRIVILCNPNNPTGLTIAPTLLREIVRRCGEVGCRLLLDECFIDFLDEPERHTAIGLLGEYPELVMVRAFTKLYALAGVRLGCALSADEAFLEAMRRAGPPWAVSAVAQRAGVAALHDEDYVAAVRALIRAERPRLAEGLRALGLRVVPGEANFLLFQSPVPLDGELRARGILLRGCADFAGLDETWYRAAVRTREDNDRLLAALEEVLA